MPDALFICECGCWGSEPEGFDERSTVCICSSCGQIMKRILGLTPDELALRPQDQKTLNLKEMGND